MTHSRSPVLSLRWVVVESMAMDWLTAEGGTGKRSNGRPSLAALILVPVCTVDADRMTDASDGMMLFTIGSVDRSIIGSPSKGTCGAVGLSNATERWRLRHSEEKRRPVLPWTYSNTFSSTKRNWRRGSFSWETTPYVRPSLFAHLWSAMEQRFDVSCRGLHRNKLDSGCSRHSVSANHHVYILVWFRSRLMTCSECFGVYVPIVDADVWIVMDAEYPSSCNLIQTPEHVGRDRKSVSLLKCSYIPVGNWTMDVRMKSKQISLCSPSLASRPLRVAVAPSDATTLNERTVSARRCSSNRAYRSFRSSMDSLAWSRRRVRWEQACILRILHSIIKDNVSGIFTVDGKVGWSIVIARWMKRSRLSIC